MALSAILALDSAHRRAHAHLEARCQGTASQRHVGVAAQEIVNRHQEALAERVQIVAFTNLVQRAC